MDYKVYVKDEATSKKVQEHAFKLGYSWVYNERNVKYANQPFLYFNYPDISFDTANVGFAEFKNEPEIEVTSEEFLALPISGFNVTKMTELQAYEISRDLWGFLTKYPEKNKTDWEFYDYYELKWMECNCTLCYKYSMDNCRDCFLYQDNVCLNRRNNSSVYYKWCTETDMTNKAALARIIYNALNDKVKMLQAEQNKTKAHLSCEGCWVFERLDKIGCRTYKNHSNWETIEAMNTRIRQTTNTYIRSKEQNKLFDPDKMTEIEAYRISMEMWEFLAGDPKRKKRDWYKYKAYLIERMKGSCPVCHFNKANCSECFLKYEHVCNCDKGSEDIAYYTWNHVHNLPEERQEAAKEIYKALKTKYELLIISNCTIQCVESTKYKYTHEQIMTGWFRQKYINNEGIDESYRCNWIKILEYNSCHKTYASKSYTSRVFKREDFNSWEYSALPPEG
jgi:hypothetical protein